MKNNHPKLKWWQKGALVGLGLGVVTFYLVQLAAGFLPAAFIFGMLNLLVLPFYLLFSKLLENIIDPSFGIGWALSVHFICWILAGIVYAGIFHTIRRLTKEKPSKEVRVSLSPMIYLYQWIKRKGFKIPWKKILIVAALIIAGAIGYLGYHLYETSQRPAPLPILKEPVIEDETANWEISRNEKYGFEIKYPKDWKIVNVDWTAGREYVQFLSPLINNKYYFVLNFGARNKGDNTQISYQPDEDWELLKSLMRLGDKVKIGNVDVLTTEIVEKGKVHSILYSNRLGAGRIEISGLEIQANSGFIEGSQHLSASDVESIDLKNLPELKLANQILSTLKFIE